MTCCPEPIRIPPRPSRARYLFVALVAWTVGVWVAFWWLTS